MIESIHAVSELNELLPQSIQMTKKFRLEIESFENCISEISHENKFLVKFPIEGELKGVALCYLDHSEQESEITQSFTEYANIALGHFLTRMDQSRHIMAEIAAPFFSYSGARNYKYEFLNEINRFKGFNCIKLQYHGKYLVDGKGHKIIIQIFCHNNHQIGHA